MKITRDFESALRNVLPTISALEADEDDRALQEKVYEFKLIPGLELTLSEVRENPWCLKKALTRQMMYYHPDKNQDPDAHHVFLVLSKFKDYYLEGYTRETEVHGRLRRHIRLHEAQERERRHYVPDPAAIVDPPIVDPPIVDPPIVDPPLADPPLADQSVPQPAPARATAPAARHRRWSKATAAAKARAKARMQPQREAQAQQDAEAQRDDEEGQREADAPHRRRNPGRQARRHGRHG